MKSLNTEKGTRPVAKRLLAFVSSCSRTLDLRARLDCMVMPSHFMRKALEGSACRHRAQVEVSQLPVPFILGHESETLVRPSPEAA